MAGPIRLGGVDDAIERPLRTGRAQRPEATGPQAPEGKETASQNAVLERLLRYERRIENSLYRMLNQLRRVRDQIQKEELEDPSILERWWEGDWSARKARVFACCPPAEAPPGPTAGGAAQPTIRRIAESYSGVIPEEEMDGTGWPRSYSLRAMRWMRQDQLPLHPSACACLHSSIAASYRPSCSNRPLACK
jgi:hypothetical protein